MSRLGVSKIDKPLRDEDKWLGMTKKQLLYLIITAVLSINILRITNAMHLFIVGIIEVILLIIFVALLCFVKIPYKNYLTGGGLTAEQFFLRCVHRRRKCNRKVYSAVVTPQKKKKKGVRLPF